MELSIRKPTLPLKRVQVLSSLFLFLMMISLVGCASGGARKDAPLRPEEAEKLMRSEDCESEEVSTQTEPGEMLRTLMEKESIGRLKNDQFLFLLQRTLCAGREGPPDYIQVVQNHRVTPVTKSESMVEYRVDYDWIGTLLPLIEEERTELKWDTQSGTFSRRLRFYRTSLGWKVESSYFADGEFLPASVVLTQYGSRLSPEVRKLLEDNL